MKSTGTYSTMTSYHPRSFMVILTAVCFVGVTTAAADSVDDAIREFMHAEMPTVDEAVRAVEALDEHARKRDRDERAADRRAFVASVERTTTELETVQNRRLNETVDLARRDAERRKWSRFVSWLGDGFMAFGGQKMAKASAAEASAPVGNEVPADGLRVKHEYQRIIELCEGGECKRIRLDLFREVGLLPDAGRERELYDSFSSLRCDLDAEDCVPLEASSAARRTVARVDAIEHPAILATRPPALGNGGTVDRASTSRAGAHGVVKEASFGSTWRAIRALGTILRNTPKARAARGLGSLFNNGRVAKASELAAFAQRQGWTRVQSATGPMKFVDRNGVARLTLKRGSSRASGSGGPHAEFRNVDNVRIDAFGNPIRRKSKSNHRPIEFDL